ncbi:helix-turn-helix domain-containing protein (plasmid) [Citricoccus sp. SGAir0253]|uniref:helix-turn-helix domain-containing protein n=1 Tax=Citricoccus sp. SGAir0253 TaxID=2567881 RepID=UPI0010CD4898|nr:helix-turn-helix domain-containing protein [Citricoccus sp. SGAir0253]QCU79690.1 helix-turn-helix domain-containing protein [Citricoccus sp. SGAir0253]
MPYEHLGQATARVLRFSTRGISPASRVRLWEDHNARALISLDIRTIEDSPLHAGETNLHLPSLKMASVAGTPQIVERSESFIRENPTDVVAVFFALEGEAFFFHHGGHIVLRPGQAIVYDADRPFVRGFSHGFREMVLTIPRPLYAELMGASGPALPTVFDFEVGAGPSERALARLLQSTLATIAAPTPDPSSRAEAASSGAGPSLTDPRPDLAGAEDDAMGLLRVILAAPGGSATGYVAAAKDHIERNLRDSGLTTAQVAAAIGISERQLGRMFAEADTTVGRYILGRRLDRARDALSAPECGRLSVAEIAAQFGFASQSHFGRVFRQRFGLTPLQWRKEARRGHLLS